MYQFLMVLFLGWVPSSQTERSLRLESQKNIDFSGWVLKGDTEDELLPFDDNATLILPQPSGAVSFEILDLDQRVRFFGLWANYANQTEIVIHIGGNLNINQVVSVSRIRQDAFGVPVEVSVIRPMDSEERAATQTSDWLKEQAEVLLQKTNLGGGSPVMRGMSGNRILLMVDGFRLNNATFRLGLNQYLNTVPGSQLQQIEILSGPSGVQYGSDGLGGTVHLRSADPASAESKELAYKGSVSTEDGTHTHSVSGVGQVGDLWFQGHFQANRYQDLEAAEPVGTQAATGYNAWDSSFNLSYAPSEGKRLRLINTYSRALHVPRTDRILSGKDLLWEYSPQEFAMSGVRYETQAHSTFFDHADLGFARMLQKEGNPRISSATPDILTNTSTTVETLQLNGTFTKAGKIFQLVYGFDGSEDSLDASGSQTDLVTGEVTQQAGKFPDDSSYKSLGLFAIGEWDLENGLRMKAGLRQSYMNLKGELDEPFGKVDQSYQHLTPSLSVGYLAERSYVSVAASQGFRAPSIEDALSLGPSNQGFDAPNPELDPEDVWNYELNWRLRLGQGVVQSSVYTARYADLVDRVPGTWQGSSAYNDEPVFILDNVGSARVDGVSLSWNQPLGQHQVLRADAAWVYGTQTETGVPMTRIPPLRGNLSWQFTREAWRLSSTFSWAGRQDRLSPGDLGDSRIPENGTPGYAVLHLRSRYHFNEYLSFNLALENVADKLYKQHGSGIYEPGRRVLFGLDARWK